MGEAADPSVPAEPISGFTMTRGPKALGYRTPAEMFQSRQSGWRSLMFHGEQARVEESNERRVPGTSVSTTGRSARTLT